MTGLEQLQAAILSHYPEQEPLSFVTREQYLSGGPDPLDQVLVYQGEDPQPYWLYVGAGLSDITPAHVESHLPRLSESGKQLSGWGVEFVMRLAKGRDEQPPAWPPALFQQLARHVIGGGESLQSGSMIITGKPIVSGVETQLTGLVFTLDPEFGQIDTDQGLVQFLEVIPITTDEAEFAAANGTEAFVTLLLTQRRKGIVELGRGSIDIF